MVVHIVGRNLFSKYDEVSNGAPIDRNEDNLAEHLVTTLPAVACLRSHQSRRWIKAKTYQRTLDTMRDMVSLPTPRGGSVKIVEQGNGTPVVFLHSGVGSAGEWREVFSLWPTGYRVIAVDAFRGGSGPGLPTHRTIDDFADQVHAVVGYVGQPIHLVGFSWGGATGLHMAATAPTALASLAVIEPEAYSLLEAEDGPAFTTLVNLRDRWRGHIQLSDWYAAFEEFIDFYNGRGSFAAWPAARRDAFLEDQRTRGDLWDVLFNAPITARSLASVATPVHVIEGSTTSIVDRAICQAVIRNVQNAKHSVIDGAGHMIPLSHPVDLTRVLVGQIA